MVQQHAQTVHDRDILGGFRTLDERGLGRQRDEVHDRAREASSFDRILVVHPERGGVHYQVRRIEVVLRRPRDGPRPRVIDAYRSREAFGTIARTIRH